jgi:hypothetical protein
MNQLQVSISISLSAGVSSRFTDLNELLELSWSIPSLHLVTYAGGIQFSCKDLEFCQKEIA